MSAILSLILALLGLGGLAGGEGGDEDGKSDPGPADPGVRVTRRSTAGRRLSEAGARPFPQNV